MSETGFQFYRYTPSTAAAVIFIILFITSASHHAFKIITRRTFYMIPLLIGCLCEYPVLQLQLGLANADFE